MARTVFNDLGIQVSGDDVELVAHPLMLLSGDATEPRRSTLGILRAGTAQCKATTRNAHGLVSESGM